MNIVICDYCNREESLVEAVDIVPAVTLMLSKQKVSEIGLCSEHKAALFPESFASNGTPKRSYTPRKVKDEAEVQPVKVKQPARPKRKLKEVIANGQSLLTTGQIAELIHRPMKSMGYVLHGAEPVGQDPSKRSAFVYSRDELIRTGVLK